MGQHERVEGLEQDKAGLLERVEAFQRREAELCTQVTPTRVQPQLLYHRDD